MKEVTIDVQKVGEITIKAGQAILDIYRSDYYKVSFKDDCTPFTTADKASHEIIHQGLSKLYPDIPILSEEGKHVPYQERQNWERFWLIDPLDGTKEFIKRNGEFSVNIALVEGQRPVLGVIYSPVQERLFFAAREGGAWRQDKKGKTEPIQAREIIPEEGITVLESHSYPSHFLQDLLNDLNIRDRISLGSSLKFCAVAEGKADAYVREGPTWEWDTAAGQCLVEIAGGKVLNLEGQPLTYNKPSLKNEGFIVMSRPVQRFIKLTKDFKKWPD